MFDTPVALFIFNRPEVTRQTFEAIARAKPKRLALIADGPRHRADEAPCELARNIAGDVHWECEVTKLFSDRNLGCRGNVSRGLDWVFSQFDSAIILEDDCVPATDFFEFCDLLLARYADDERVTMIGGSAPAGGISSQFSYLFSRYTLIWGWATWKRAWSGYDVSMKAWPDDRDGGLLEHWLEDEGERLHWCRRFDKTHAGHTTWDHQWAWHCWRRAGLTALPTTNLVTNIGFGSDATHTTSLADAARLSVPSGRIAFPLRHPTDVTRDAALDARIYREILNS
ncbi:MAG: glycosyltransferase family 2 protein [Pseudomonadota bacterium]